MAALPVELLGMNRGNAATYFGQAYHAVYRNLLLPDEQTQAEVDFLLQVLRPRPGAVWLDVPCGYGRHLLALRNRRPDLRLLGGDLNFGYLHEPGLREAARVCRLNMLQFPFATRSCHVVLMLLNSFGYFGPGGDEAMLAEAARVLRPGGRLVLDVANRRALLGIVRRSPRVHYCSGDYETIEDFAWDARREMLLNETAWQGPGGYQRASYALRLYTPTQLMRLLGRAGLSVTRQFGDFSGDPFTADSDRLLLIAKR
jgi:SAM-dependent methyltransferase